MQNENVCPLFKIFWESAEPNQVWGLSVLRSLNTERGLMGVHVAHPLSLFGWEWVRQWDGDMRWRMRWDFIGPKDTRLLPQSKAKKDENSPAALNVKNDTIVTVVWCPESFKVLLRFGGNQEQTLFCKWEAGWGRKGDQKMITLLVSGRWGLNLRPSNFHALYSP